MKLYSKYKINIADSPVFDDLHGDANQATAALRSSVLFYNEDYSDSQLMEYTVAPIEEIYSRIDQGLPLELENCLVMGFSIDGYRESRGLGPADKVTINGINARNAFFEAIDNQEEVKGAGISMYNVCIAGEACDFSGAYFGAGGVNMQEIEYQCSRVLFKEACFMPGQLQFSDSEFGNCEIDFSESNMSEGDKLFTDCTFGKCELKFSSVTFGSGSIDFSFSKFRQANLIFTKSQMETGNLNFSKVSFGKGNIDFSYFHFGKGDIFFLNTKFNDGNLYFLGASIGDGNVDFYRSRFGNGAKDFSYVRFGCGTKNFSSVKFGNGNVSFNNADFNCGDVNFSKAQFGDGNKEFQQCNFGDGKIDFNSVKFGNGNINMLATRFNNGNVDFTDVSVESGELSLKKTVYGRGDLFFDRADLSNAKLNLQNCLFNHNSISLYGALLNAVTFRNSQFDHYTDLRVFHCQTMDLRNTIIRDILDMKPDGLVPVEIKNINFAEVKNSGMIFIDWTLNNIKHSIRYQKNTTQWQKAEQFRMLKENFHQIGQYDDEDDSYCEFKRFDLKSEYLKVIKSSKSHWYNKVSAAISYGFKYLVFDKMGGFGTSPLKVLKSMVVFFILFSALYYMNQDVPSFDAKSGNLMQETKVEDALYFSAYNLLIIGYEDYHPHGVTGFLSVVESFLGLFLMSYFTVAFVRKVLR